MDLEENMEGAFREGRSLKETPTWSVATVTTVMVFVCLFAQRSIYRFGRVSSSHYWTFYLSTLVFSFLNELYLLGFVQWLKKTRRKALFASVEKIKEGDQSFMN